MSQYIDDCNDPQLPETLFRQLIWEDDDGNLYLFDTNDREYGAELFTALKATDKIVWFKRFEKGCIDGKN